MSQLIRFYRLLNILSVDVALGAVCCAAWFAVLFEVNLRPSALVSLGLTVWIIYTVDHLLDARKIKGPASTDRHRFHQENFAFLFGLLVLAIVTDLFFVFFIRKVVFQSGIVLSAVMVFYFLLQRYLRYFKEFIIALLFSCGVLLPSWSLAKTIPNAELTLLISQFMLTALLNLLLFSWFDRDNDRKDNRESFVTLIGESRTKRIVLFLFVVNALLMSWSILYSPDVIYKVLIIFLMNVILAIIFFQRERFEVNDRFRLIGDSIFLLPALYILM